MIRNIEAAISQSRHYGATDADAYCLRLQVTFDAKQFSKLDKKGLNPIRAYQSEIFDRLYLALPWLQDSMKTIHLQSRKDWKRARLGKKTIEASIYLSKAEAAKSGVDTSKWGIYHKLDLDAKLPHNVIQVNFKTKRKVG